MRRPRSRRSVLRASAVGGAYALAGGTLVGSSTGKLVITYDDGPIEDYTKVLPVHREEGVPGCLGVISNRLGHSEHWLNAEHVREFEAEGWEVVGHTLKHRALDEVPLP